MAYNKIWLGTTSADFAIYTNFQKISIRSSAFSWTASGSGTNEYYLRTSGSADPALGAQPGGVYIDGTLATSGSLGSLAAGRWGYGDNDTLGYSTVYVRLSDGADPDSKANGFVQFQAVPNGADPVTLSGSAVNGITSNVDASALSAAAWVIEPGFKNLPLGSPSQPFRIKPSALTIDGGGNGSSPWYIDIGSQNISVTVRNAPNGLNGLRGLYLMGTNMATVTVFGGSVGVGVLPGDTTTVAATVLSVGGQADVYVGSGVTNTTARSTDGKLTTAAPATTYDCEGGTFTTLGAAVATAVTIQGGTFDDRSTGTHAAVTLNHESATYDTRNLGGAKTVTSFKHNLGTFLQNEIGLLTVTTYAAPDYPVKAVRTRAA